MISFESFEKALKITWIRRILRCNGNSKLLNLFNVFIKDCNFDFTSNIYWKNIIVNCHNNFWKDVIVAWNEMVALLVPNNRDDVLCSSIWNNDKIKIGKKSVLYK